jgi:hypothetical protein
MVMASLISGLSVRKYIRAIRDYVPSPVRSSSHEVRRNLKSQVADEYVGVDDRPTYGFVDTGRTSGRTYGDI